MKRRIKRIIGKFLCARGWHHWVERPIMRYCNRPSCNEVQQRQWDGATKWK